MMELRVEMLKFREKILHAVENNKHFYNVNFTDQDNIIDIDHKGKSYKIIIEECGN